MHIFPKLKYIKENQNKKYEEKNLGGVKTPQKGHKEKWKHASDIATAPPERLRQREETTTKT